MARVPIPDDWDGVSWCEWAICWPDSELYEGLLRGLITNLTRGRYWDETTGSVIDAQQVGYQILDRNILLRRCIVSCTEGIENAIRYLADAIYNKPCCSGSDGGGVPGGANGGVPGLVTTPTTEQTYPTIGEEVPYTLPDGQTWPEDLFETEQDFQDYKCAAAHQIVDGAVSTLRALGALTIANITGAAVIVGLAFAGAIAFPPAGIPILLSAIGALAGGLVVLQQLGDNIQTNREDYICALYEGESTDLAIGAVLELIDEAMATLAFGATVQPYVRIVATFIFSTDTVNRLFNKLLDYNYPDADCSGCGVGECDMWNWFEVSTGTVVSQTVTEDQITLEIDSGPIAGYQGIVIRVVPGAEYCDNHFRIDALALTKGNLNTNTFKRCTGAEGSTPPGSDYDWPINDADNSWNRIEWTNDGFVNEDSTLTMTLSKRVTCP